MEKKTIDKISKWIKQYYSSSFKIEVASSDASFRSYYRITSDDDVKIVMDSPPDKEPLQPFLDVNKRLLEAKINVPIIYEVNESSGLVLMSDLGKIKYLDALNNETVFCLYTDAIDAIDVMQKNVNTSELSNFDKQEQASELGLFKKWFLKTHLNIDEATIISVNLDEAFNVLLDNITKIPTAFIHRDFHSRNLMLTKTNNPGVLDYQDAMIGPITYDLVSLLKDCYINWNEELIKDMSKSFYTKIKDQHSSSSFEEFIYWLDITGVQRHLKAIGIFSRLKYRDNKPSYMEDIKRTFGYIDNIINKYPDMQLIKKAFDILDIKGRL